jgi:hypothetical protein
MLKKLFIEHPKTVNETYIEHFIKALGFSIQLLCVAATCFVHALVLGFFVKTSSKAVVELHKRMAMFP